jgi:hypothetical protein
MVILFNPPAGHIYLQIYHNKQCRDRAVNGIIVPHIISPAISLWRNGYTYECDRVGSGRVC